MFEEHFVCTFELLRSIPSPDAPELSVRDDIVAFNRAVRGSSNCRLVCRGKKADFSRLGLGVRDLLDLGRLLFLQTEKSLENRTIDRCFRGAFFKTNFWLMWSTMFSFQQWHSAIEMRRYLRRFIHLFPGLERIEGVLRTRYNQYDSIIEPIVRWLTKHGVRIETGAHVTDLEIVLNGQARRIGALALEDGRRIDIDDLDRVYLTLGSMADASKLGSNRQAPDHTEYEGGSWPLWRTLAARHSGFGHPEKFCGSAHKTGWVSFTVTLRNPGFFEFMEQFTGNASGTGGLVTFADSGWLLSIVMFHQPHFRNQDAETFAFWGYGLRSDRDGDFVRKPMWDCTGNEIASELAGQLHLSPSQRKWFDGARIIPCWMPHITSQLMPRQMGDRPLVRPPAAENFAVIGQYCEIPHDTVFTVEYSVRSAVAAVCEMTGLRQPPPPVVRFDRNPIILLQAARKLIGL